VIGTLTKMSVLVLAFECSYNEVKNRERKIIMHFTGQVYRHPMEANTPLLQVTAGCSHNKCTFCTMYRKTQFGVSPLDHVREDLEELKSYGKPVKRIFLVNGEPFVLSTDKLIAIGQMINEYFPDIETITCYTSIMNLKRKSLEDLKQLRALKFNELHIGIETAYDPALLQMNKGFTKEEAYENLQKLKEAGIDWDALIMTGVAGKDHGKEHIEETAQLINDFPPYMISIMPTSVPKGSDLEVLRDKGEFLESTELENLEEQKELLRLINVNSAYLFASHVFSLIPVSGPLSHKSEIIDYIDKRIGEISPQVLNGIKERPNI